MIGSFGSISSTSFLSILPDISLYGKEKERYIRSFFQSLFSLVRLADIRFTR